MDPTELLDTYLHELLHAQNPKATEAEIDKITTELIDSLTEDDKKQLLVYIKKLLK